VSVSVRDDGTDSSDHSVLKLFLLGMMCAVQAVVFATQQPYIKWRENCSKLTLSLAQVAQAGFMLGAQRQGFDTPYFYATVLIFVIIVFLLLFRGKCPCLSGEIIDHAAAAQLAQKQQQQQAQLQQESQLDQEETDEDQLGQGGNTLEMGRRSRTNTFTAQSRGGAAYTIRRPGTFAGPAGSVQGGTALTRGASLGTGSSPLL